MLVQIFLPSSSYLSDPLTILPLGPLYVAAGIQELGHEVILTSLLDDADICDGDIMPADAFMIGFVTPQFDEAVRLCHRVRRVHPGAAIIAGGPHPTVRPKEVLRAGFDLVVTGEADSVLEEVLAKAKAKGRGIVSGFPVKNLDSVPFPARNLLPASHLWNDQVAIMRQDYGGVGIASLVCSRGCPYDCAFCGNPVTGRGTRFRSPGNILGEVQAIIEEFGITSFRIQDDTFTLRKEFVFALSEASRRRFGDSVAYRVHTRVDVFDEEVAQTLLAMNTRMISFGFESGSQTVLNAVNKGTTVEQSLKAAKIAKRAGFDTVSGFLIFGLPGESAETLDETKQFLEQIRPYVDGMSVGTTIPYPGSAIGDYPEEFNSRILCKDYGRYWTVNQEDVIFLPSGIPSIETYKELRIEFFRQLIELGWVRKEWKDDAIGWLLEDQGVLDL